MAACSGRWAARAGAPLVVVPEGVGLEPRLGFFIGGFFVTKALAAGLFLRMTPGAGALGVVEFDPEGGVCPSGVVMFAIPDYMTSAPAG